MHNEIHRHAGGYDYSKRNCEYLNPFFIIAIELKKKFLLMDCLTVSMRFILNELEK